MSGKGNLFVMAVVTAGALFGLNGCGSAADEPTEADEMVAENSADNSADNAQSEIAPLFMGREIFLRGEMNDYGVQRPYRLRRFEENTFCTLAALRSDWSPYRFKFADANWSNGTNFGYAVPPAVIRKGAARTMLNPNSRYEELRYELNEDGIYRFCLIYDNDIPYATVTRLENDKLTTMDELIKKEMEKEFAPPPAGSLSADNEQDDLSDDEDD